MAVFAPLYILASSVKNKVPIATSLVAQTVKHLSTMQETRVRFLGWEDPLDRKWQSTPVLLPGKSHGQRSLVGYSLWGRKESDGACVYFWAFYLVPLVYVSVFVQYHTVLMTVAL